MKITYKQKPEDPVYPIMHGPGALAKEFNKRQKANWATGNVDKVDFEQITTVLMEIFEEDYNRRHALRKKADKKK